MYGLCSLYGLQHCNFSAQAKQTYQTGLQILLKNHGFQISNPGSYNFTPTLSFYK